LLTDLGNGLLKFGVLFDVLAALGVLLLFLIVLDDRLFLQLTDVSGHPLEVSLELCNLGVCFEQILRVEVTVGSDSLVEVELELEFGLSLQVLLLELSDQVVLQLNLLEALVVLGVSESSLIGIDLLIFLQLNVFLAQFNHFDGIRVLSEHDFGQLLLVHLNFVLGLALGLFLGDQVSIQKLALVDLSIDLLFLVFDPALLLLLPSDFLLELLIFLFTLSGELRASQTCRISLLLDHKLLLGQLA